MEMKPHRNSLGCNSLSDVSYENPGMVLNGNGLGRHPLGDVSYLDLDTMLNEKGSDCHIFSDTLHRCLGVVKNEQVSSYLTQRMHMVRKLAKPSRLRVGSWNVESLTSKLQEIVDTMIRRRVNIFCVQKMK
jgi:hypothetical protein